MIATVKMITAAEAISKIAAGLTKSIERMSPIDRFLRTSNKQEEKKVDYVENEETGINPARPAPLSSEASD